MKNILLLLLAVLSLNVQAQKKKPVKKKPVATASKSAVLAKSDNLTAELLEKKDTYLFYTLLGKDTLFSKPV